MSHPRHSSTRLGRRTLLGGAAAALGLAAAGCTSSESGGAPGSGTVSLMSNVTADWEAQLRENITRIQGKHSGLTMELLNVSDGEQFYTKIKTQALSKTLPDIFYVRTLELVQFAKDGWIQPLDDVVAKNPDLVKPDDIWPAATAQATVDGKWYGINEDLSCFVIYVNKALFEKKGIPLPTDDWTWEEYFALAAEFKEMKGNRQTVWGGSVSSGSYGMRGILRSNGGEFFDDAGTPVLTSDANIQTLQTIQKAVRDGVIPGPDSLPTGVNPFAAGMLAMQMNGSWGTAANRAAIDDFEWDVVKLPKGTTGKREIVTAGGTWALGRDTKNPELAGLALAEWTSAESQENVEILVTTPSLPARKSFTEGIWKTGHDKELADGKPPTGLYKIREQITEEASTITYPATWATFDVSWNNTIPGLLTSDDPRPGLQTVQDATLK